MFYCKRFAALLQQVTQTAQITWMLGRTLKRYKSLHKYLQIFPDVFSKMIVITIAVLEGVWVHPLRVFFN